jgi:hypothetical protein
VAVLLGLRTVLLRANGDARLRDELDNVAGELKGAIDELRGREYHDSTHVLGDLITGLTGLLFGAISMAIGECVSVQSARELYQRQVRTEAAEIRSVPDEEEEELALIYEANGLPQDEARQVDKRLIADKKTALDYAMPGTAAGQGVVVLARGDGRPRSNRLRLASRPSRSWRIRKGVGVVFGPSVRVCVDLAFSGVGRLRPTGGHLDSAKPRSDERQ